MSVWNAESMILYEDQDLLVCHKEAGVPVQSARFGTMDLESALKNYLAAQNPGALPYVGVIHRLDQPVEGVVVFAKNRKAASGLNRQLTGGRIEKTYLAVTGSAPEKEAEELLDFLIKDGRSNTSFVAAGGTAGAKEARLSYQVAEKREAGTLLQIRLDTGRHHQIRVQMAHHGMPLLGDRKYGGEENGGELALCSFRLAFVHPRTGKRMCFQISPHGKAFAEFTFCQKISDVEKRV